VEVDDGLTGADADVEADALQPASTNATASKVKTRLLVNGMPDLSLRGLRCTHLTIRVAPAIGCIRRVTGISLVVW
jgi:hypothetical protein